jgi:hypothetical protein
MDRAKYIKFNFLKFRFSKIDFLQYRSARFREKFAGHPKSLNSAPNTVTRFAKKQHWLRIFRSFVENVKMDFHIRWHLQ